MTPPAQRGPSALPPIRRIKACLNGGRSEPFVPRRPAELSASATGAVAAGAEAVHLHPRDAAGRESLAAQDIGPAVRAVRAAGVPVGVSTGLWMTGGDAARRFELVAAWATLPDRPDFASVNVSEDGYDDLVTLLAGMGVAVEAGVWSPADAARVGPADRVLVEVIGAAAPEAVPAADAILARLGGVGGTDVPILLHGEDEACWPLVAHAGRLGLPTRVGFEDTLTGPSGEPVATNAELVRLALRVWAGAARPTPG